MLIKLLVIAVAFYCSLLTLLFFKQRSMVFNRTENFLSVNQATDIGLAHWPSVERYRGYLANPSQQGYEATIDKTVVLFHGNAGVAYERAHFLAPLQQHNARVLLAEYPGYGKRDGMPTESTLISDSLNTLSQIATAYPDQPIYLLGESLGTGVVAGILGHLERQPAGSPDAKLLARIQATLLVTPFDSLANVAQAHYPWVPAKWLIRDPFNSVSYLESHNGLVAVVIAGNDQVTANRFSERLYQSLSGRKQDYVVSDAGHTEWIHRVDEAWWNTVFTFLAQTKESNDNL